jgi:hypothetical protein
VRGKSIYKRGAPFGKPQKFPVIVSQCLWASYLFAVAHAAEEDLEDYKKVKEALEERFLEHPEDHNL